MLMNIICFGVSNTYGYNLRGNMGQNGREIPPTAPVFPADIHAGCN